MVVPAGASRCLRLASRLAAVFPAERQGFARAVQAHVLAWFLQNYRPQYVTLLFLWGGDDSEAEVCIASPDRWLCITLHQHFSCLSDGMKNAEG